MARSVVEVAMLGYYKALGGRNSSKIVQMIYWMAAIRVDDKRNYRV
jgi:hypothetical protein